MGNNIPSAAGSGLLLVKTATWEALRRRVEGMEILPDAEQFEVARRGGKTFFRAKLPAAPAAPADGARAGGDAVSYGAFYTMRVVEAAGDATGDIYLQGGMVSGSEGNVSVAEIKLYDAGTDTWQGSSGNHIILSVTGDGQATSGILDPVYKVTAVSHSITSSVGANTLPAVGSLTGKICKISLGTFYAGGFGPAKAGNISIQFCWGGYSHNH